MKESGYHFQEDYQGNKKLTFYLNILDMEFYRPDDFEIILQEECDKSPLCSDKLLALESIFRNIEKNKIAAKSKP